MNLLKHLLNPHFFFNTLNSISTLIETDAKLAQNILADLSDLLRDTVNLKDTSFVCIKEEMNILKKYIDIMCIRFSNDLEITMNIENGLDEIFIPSLILLPIIESTINNGYSYDHTKLKIKLELFKRMSNLVMEIENDGQFLINEKTKYETVLKDTEDRLNKLYHDKYLFSIENNKNLSGFKTIIQLPIQAENLILT